MIFDVAVADGGAGIFSSSAARRECVCVCVGRQLCLTLHVKLLF